MACTEEVEQGGMNSDAQQREPCVSAMTCTVA
jgi:hypothetical protein